MYFSDKFFPVMWIRHERNSHICGFHDNEKTQQSFILYTHFESSCTNLFEGFFGNKVQHKLNEMVLRKIGFLCIVTYSMWQHRPNERALVVF